MSGPTWYASREDPLEHGTFFVSLVFTWHQIWLASLISFNVFSGFRVWGFMLDEWEICSYVIILLPLPPKVLGNHTILRLHIFKGYRALLHIGAFGCFLYIIYNYSQHPGDMGVTHDNYIQIQSCNEKPTIRDFYNHVFNYQTKFILLCSHKKSML